ncbi:hypothetical protein ASF93_11710 [Microbacterium sp. Leaf347]|uniref:hypothetical protein n=1 Tax=Microbacterium TaxID=33882 RepID=UPI0006F8693D|nr:MULTISPECIES: hypothetical protein [unclassified Microbacterium]KQS00119.1 hypothetical protein ASF93_11710 [Microbacterium sp. Leaf347]
MGSIHRNTTAAGAKRYHISYRAPDFAQRTVRGSHTKFDAEIRLAEIEVSKARGEYVEPQWGARVIDSIRHSEVQSWVSALKGGSTTFRRSQGIVAGILDAAVADRLLARNVARGLKLPPKSADARRRYLSHTQVRLLADQRGTPRWCCSWRTRDCDGERRRRYASGTWTPSAGSR